MDTLEKFFNGLSLYGKRETCFFFSAITSIKKECLHGQVFCPFSGRIVLRSRKVGNVSIGIPARKSISLADTENLYIERIFERKFQRKIGCNVIPLFRQFDVSQTSNPAIRSFISKIKFTRIRGYKMLREQIHKNQN